MTLPLITTAMANTYFATTPRDAQWAAITGAEQAISLTEAQTWLGQLCWNTTADCCGNTFDASYTRAVSELALALHSNPTALIGGAAATAALGPVKRQKLDALEVEYFDPRGSGSTATATAPTAKGPLVLQRFPWLKDIIGCFLTNTGNSNLIRRVRS
jgi:acyl-homoserine lactone acylase PvdQ